VALVLTGSRARADGWADDLSDLDVEVVAIDVGALAEDDGWIHALGNVMVHLALANEPGPATRLVFYEGGDKVDFTLCGRSRLHAMNASGHLNDLYERGYRVLLDKEGLTVGLPAARGRRPSRRLPDQVDLDAIVTEFFFEAAHIPRYLMRDELWLVKSRRLDDEEVSGDGSGMARASRFTGRRRCVAHGSPYGVVGRRAHVAGATADLRAHGP
jgi:aminoglycoside 6-adenylyltransferase